MITLETLIDRCVHAKQGNKEFALFRYGERQWRAEIGNPSLWARLGRACGEVYSEVEATPERAVTNLLGKLGEGG